MKTGRWLHKVSPAEPSCLRKFYKAEEESQRGRDYWLPLRSTCYGGQRRCQKVLFVGYRQRNVEASTIAIGRVTRGRGCCDA